MTLRTADEAKAHNILQMGEELGTTYSALWQELAWIHKKWAQYVSLFGTNPERIDLLNQAAPSMFRTVQDTLWEDVLLHIARLTDPPESPGKKSNLTIRRLEVLVKEASVRQNVKALTDTAVAESKFARDWRNRRLAHRDLDLALGQHVEPLAPASRAAVKTALASLTKIINAVSIHYSETTITFELGMDDIDAMSLLYTIRDGIRHDEERKEKLKRGEIHWQDIKPEPL